MVNLSDLTLDISQKKHTKPQTTNLYATKVRLNYQTSVSFA